MIKGVKNELARLVAAAGYSLHGLAAAYRGEAAFRLEVWLAAGLIPLALWLEVSPGERALLILSALLPPAFELLNTAAEAVTDLAMPQQHALAKKAKDVASAAVLVAVISAAAVWLIILWPLLRAAAAGG